MWLEHCGWSALAGVLRRELWWEFYISNAVAVVLLLERGLECCAVALWPERGGCSVMAGMLWLAVCGWGELAEGWWL